MEPQLSSHCIARAQPLSWPRVLHSPSAPSAANIVASERSSAMSPYATSSVVHVLRVNVALALLRQVDGFRDQIASLVVLHRADAP